MGTKKYFMLAGWLLLSVFTQAQNNDTLIDNDSIEVTYMLNQYAKYYPDTLHLFKKYGNSNFYSTTFVADNKINYAAINYEYILHNDTLLCVNKDLLNDFLYVFAKNPNAFGNFSTANGVGWIAKWYEIDADDYVRMHTNFKWRTNIENRDIIHSINEEIWRITTSTLSSGPCYINMIFNYKSKKVNRKPVNLKYVTAKPDYCEL